MIVARLVRCFETVTPAGGEVEQRLGKVLELPIPPARGQHLILPGDPEPRPVDRVIVHARLPVSASSWTPGWKHAAIMLDVLLAPESPEGLAAAFTAGWTTV